MATEAREHVGTFSGIKARLLSNILNAGATPIYVVLTVAFVIAWIVVAANGGDFMTVNNIRTMLIRSVSLGIVAVGQTFVILAGSLDLSVAYVISVTAVISSVVMDGDPANMGLAVAVVLAIGAAVGFANGIVITKFRVNAFVATLGMSLLLRGALNASFNNFAGSVPKEFQALGYNRIGPIPLAVLLLLAVFSAGWYLVNRTRWGYHIYGVGGSEETARMSGVRTDRTVILAHVLCSLTAVLTGLFIVSRLRSGAPWVGPDGGYDLESIAAVVVGGTALSGGKGGVSGTLAGVFILALLDNVFNQLQVNTFLKQIVRGFILIAAVALYAIRTRKERV